MAGVIAVFSCILSTCLTSEHSSHHKTEILSNLETSSNCKLWAPTRIPKTHPGKWWNDGDSSICINYHFIESNSKFFCIPYMVEMQQHTSKFVECLTYQKDECYIANLAAVSNLLAVQLLCFQYKVKIYIF